MRKHQHRHYPCAQQRKKIPTSSSIYLNRHHKRRWPWETGTRRRVILDLLLDLNYLQKKPSPLSRKSSATSGTTHHQILPTNQQKVSGHHQSVQSLPSGGRTIPPPLASTRADMPRPSAGAPWHLTRHTCDVASTPCQHRCQGHHVAVTSLYKGTQPLITIIPISITLPPFSRQPSPKHIQGPPWGTHQVTQQEGYLCSNQALLLWQT